MISVRGLRNDIHVGTRGVPSAKRVEREPQVRSRRVETTTSLRMPEFRAESGVFLRQGLRHKWPQ